MKHPTTPTCTSIWDFQMYIYDIFLRTIYTNLRPHVSWICFRRSASSSWLPSPGPKWFTPSCRVEQLHRRDTWPPWVSVSKFLDMTLKLQKAWIGQMAMIDRDQFLLYTEIHLNFLLCDSRQIENQQNSQYGPIESRQIKGMFCFFPHDQP